MDVYNNPKAEYTNNLVEMVFFYIKGVLYRFFNIWNIEKPTIRFNINTPCV